MSEMLPKETLENPRTDPRFWRWFEGAFSSLIASLRGGAGRWPDLTERGAIKLRKRDAILLAEGIAALLAEIEELRRAGAPPAPPEGGTPAT